MTLPAVYLPQAQDEVNAAYVAYEQPNKPDWVAGFWTR